MKRNMFVAILLLLSVSLVAQRPASRKIIPDALITMNRGIYLTLEEFLVNEPSIPYYFEIIKDKPTHYNPAEEVSSYFLTYTDMMGYKVTLNLNEVWGYNDGARIYLAHNGKPYELTHLGTISVLSYYQNSGRNIIARAFGLNSVGAAMERTDDVLLHLKNDTIVVPTARNFRQLIADDAELFQDYKADRKTDYMEKPIMYLNKYNEKHPLLITEKGIEFVDLRESSEL